MPLYILNSLWGVSPPLIKYFILQKSPYCSYLFLLFLPSIYRTSFILSQLAGYSAIKICLLVSSLLVFTQYFQNNYQCLFWRTQPFSLRHSRSNIVVHRFRYFFYLFLQYKNSFFCINVNINRFTNLYSDSFTVMYFHVLYYCLIHS